MMSIRSRLLIWLLSALLLALAVAGLLTYSQVKEDVGEMQDYGMRQIALSLQYQNGLVPHEVPDGAQKRDEEHDEQDLVAQVWSQKDQLLYSSVPGFSLPHINEMGFSERSWKGERWRFYAITSSGRTIQVAQPIGMREESAASTAFGALVPLLCLAPLLALIVWISVGRGLAPLQKVTNELNRRDSSLLIPLKTEGLPAEILPVVNALNELLARLSKSFEGQRGFLADAAHELRTPLTAVSLQAQILERSEQPRERADAVKELRSGVVRASHLVQQMLTMARLEPEAPQRPLAEVELDRIAKEAVANFVPFADKKNIDLGVERAEPLIIKGDRESLKVLIENLIDNAVRYTPSDGRIDVQVYADNGRAVLEIRDTGPGIPPEERTRVFERFYRQPGQEQPGSGLGLAIAKSIADRHQASIELLDNSGGRGLVVRIYLRLHA